MGRGAVCDPSIILLTKSRGEATNSLKRKKREGSGYFFLINTLKLEWDNVYVILSDKHTHIYIIILYSHNIGFSPSI